MPFDQNSVQKDLRPLNVAPSMAEEPIISPASVTTPPTPNSGCDLGSPGTPPIPLFYQPPSVSDAATIVGLGYGNVPSGATTAWCVRPAMSIAHANVNHAAIGYGYGPGCCNRIATGNNAVNVGSWVGVNGLDKACNDAANGFAYAAAMRGGNNRVVAIGSDQLIGGVSVSSPVNSQQSDHGGDEGSEDSSVSGKKKVKFLCSFGGKILPRPSDGVLRYVGGQTRIISVRRDVSFSVLMHKMVDTYGQPVVIKYQLPEEELDALVSVSCHDDVEHMMEEYEKLMEKSPDGSAKLRVFLFSASELEVSGGVQVGDVQDSGQKYVDAVNGIADGGFGGGGISRKESITSASSTQNSDVSGTEILEYSVAAGNGDFSGGPKGHVAASPDTNVTMVVSEPNGALSAVSSVASMASMAMPVAKTSPTHHTQYSPNEVELERSIPVTLSQHLQQSGVETPTSSPYFPAFVDPRQEAMNHAEYFQLSSQMGYSNPQFVGNTTGPVFTRQQFHDNTTALVSHQVFPGMQMTMTQQPSHVGVRPNAIQPQPLMQPQQNRLDQYNDDNTSGLRFVQFPNEHSYNTYQVPMNQAPPVIVGGNYGWVQIPQQEHGLLAQQQVMISEKNQRVEDCSLCQTKLPHAHSDSVVQDQHSSGSGPVPDSISSYHSLPSEDNSKAQATNRVPMTAPLKEGIVEQVDWTKPHVISKLEPPDRVPSTDTTGQYSHNPEKQPEGGGGRILTQKLDGFDYPMNSFMQDTIGRTGGRQSPSDALMSTAPLAYPDDVIVQQHMVPVKQDVLVNKPASSNITTVDGKSLQTSESTVQGFPKDYAAELSGVIAKSDAVDGMTQDHLKPIDGGMNNLMKRNPEIPVSTDPCLVSFDKPSGNDKLNHNNQYAVEKEVILDNLGRSKFIVDANQFQMTDTLPCSSMEISHGRNIRPGESNEAAQPPVYFVSGFNFEYNSGNHHKDDAASSIVSSVRSGGDMQDSPNSLFSNQDPWTIQHGSYREQNLGAQLDEDLNRSFKQVLTLEHGWSTKGSAEDQQLQAVAEDVAASVLHSRTASNPDPDLHDGDFSCGENIEDGSAENSLTDVQQYSAEATGVKSKPPEKGNFGFPASDVGRLQVIKNCDLEELTELGSGTFGTVYHGKWRGTDVAIKRITDRCFAGKPSEQERMRADFWNEAIKLADLHHPNVVAFYGVVVDGPGGSVATVTEYMVNGSLRNGLQKNVRNFDKRKRLLIAMDVAFGMEYLHAKNIVHFDLKSDNLLVNLRDPHRPICKVGDLGLSKVKRQTLISGGVRGTLPWMAPELLNGSSSLVSEKVDVFSFGIVMWELLTGEEPYADLHYGAIIGGIVSNTLRPQVPESCDSEWRSLMERCWSSEPSERPSFTEIVNALRSMATNSSSPKGQNQQQQPSSLQTQVQK